MFILKVTIILIGLILTNDLEKKALNESEKISRHIKFGEKNYETTTQETDSIKGDFNKDGRLDMATYSCLKGCTEISFYFQNPQGQQTLGFKSDLLNTLYSPEHEFLELSFEKGLLNFEIEDKTNFSAISNYYFIYDDSVDNFRLKTYTFWRKDNRDINLITKTCKQDFIKGSLITDIDVKKLKLENCTYVFENTGSFDEYFSAIKNNQTVTPPIFERLNYYFKQFPINEARVSNYNDIGYYLEQSRAFKESAFVLEKVIAKFPTRTVAYINLGDSYWGLKDTEKAKTAYNTYIDLMKKSGKEAKIPKRVLERVK